MFSRTGIEYIDTATNHWTPNNWVRGGCLYGVMPCNGMTYVTPHPCACYLDAKLYGFHALAPAVKSWQPKRDVPDDERLEQGPAFEALSAQRSAVSTQQSAFCSRDFCYGGLQSFPAYLLLVNQTQNKEY